MLYTITNHPRHATITPVATWVPALTKECDRLTKVYYECKRNGDHAGALNAYIRLHEIEDGY